MAVKQSKTLLLLSFYFSFMLIAETANTEQQRPVCVVSSPQHIHVVEQAGDSALFMGAAGG